MVESAGCVKFPLLGGVGGGGYICLFTVAACEDKMITVASARAASSDGSEFSGFGGGGTVGAPLDLFTSPSCEDKLIFYFSL